MTKFYHELEIFTDIPSKCKNMCYHLLLVFTVIAHVSASTCTIDLECESWSSVNQMHRSEASGGLTVRLKESEMLDIYFEIITLHSICSVSIRNVAYSNNGISDIVQSSLNGTLLGRFTTLPQVRKGNYWSKIISTGAFGDHTQLLVGRYTFTLTVLEADTYGVEFDKVTLAVECTGNTDCPEVKPDPHNEQSNGLTGATIFGIISAVIAVPGCLVASITLWKMCK